MTTEMRQTLARLPYVEKLRRVAELIDFSRRFKVGNQELRRASGAEEKMNDHAGDNTKV